MTFILTNYDHKHYLRSVRGAIVPRMDEPIRVLIIDDHEQVRRALAASLGAAPEIDVVGATGQAEEGLIKTESLKPDVVLIDPKRADGRGLEIVQRILQSGLRAQVIVLTSYLGAWEQWAVDGSGVAGSLLKEVDSAQLVYQILLVVAVRAAVLTGWD